MSRTAALDYGGAAILTSILDSMKTDKTVVMTTHNVYEGLSLCDKVAILDQGEVVYESAQKTRPRGISGYLHVLRQKRGPAVKKIALIFRKDFLVEWRSKQIFPTMFVFSLLLLLVFNVAF